MQNILFSEFQGQAFFKNLFDQAGTTRFVVVDNLLEKKTYVNSRLVRVEQMGTAQRGLIEKMSCCARVLSSTTL